MVQPLSRGGGLEHKEKNKSMVFKQKILEPQKNIRKGVQNKDPWLDH